MRSASNSASISQEASASSTEPQYVPELLAPAGSWECVRAAVENGADAIYFGLAHFNARMRAQNFTEADLPKLMEFLGRRGVKAYVTFNTLIFESELAQAEQQLRLIIDAGVDAVIVQDAGICRLIRRISPNFPIHASTQMTVSSAAGVRFAQSLGCNLVVMARECSIREIEKIQESLNTHAEDPRNPFPLEVFVHGALCVAYSGQCLTSEALGGRSANRGVCAQACRMPYELVADGKTVSLDDRSYLLSPQDLASLDALPELIRARVASIKIEGRLKSPEYVANITRMYRKELDRLIAGTTPADDAIARVKIQKNDQYEMEMAFSRGLYSGWLRGIDNQQLVHGRFGKKRGVYLGTVSSVSNDAVVLKSAGNVKPGDGVVFDSGNPASKEEGGRVYTVLENQSEQTLRFGNGQIVFSRIHSGDRVWKTSDPELDRRIRQTYSGDEPKFQRSVDFVVSGRVGSPMVLSVRDTDGRVAEVFSQTPLIAATKRPLSLAYLEAQLGRLGGTAFHLGSIENHLDKDVFISVSEINRMRREVILALDKLRSTPKRWQINTSEAKQVSRLKEGKSSVANPLNSECRDAEPPGSSVVNLIVLIRNMSQLEGVLKSGVRTVYCDFENPKGYREAVQFFRNWMISQDSCEQLCNPAIFVAPPRIFKPGDEWILKQVLSSDADGYLVRNYDHLDYFKGSRQIGDYTFNVTNRLTSEFFTNQFGLERLTASYDLNAAQLDDLLNSAAPGTFEITIHQHMPMFHMEHCVFCAFLSEGTDYRNCGRPCDTHDLKLRDRVGAEHPVKADSGCRNTVYNSLAQTGAEHIPQMIASGSRHFRIEFLNETPSLIGKTIQSYRDLINGHINGMQLWKKLNLMNQLGVTRGQI